MEEGEQRTRQPEFAKVFLIDRGQLFKMKYIYYFMYSYSFWKPSLHNFIIHAMAAYILISGFYYFRCGFCYSSLLSSCL